MTRKLLPLLGIALLTFTGSAAADLSGDYRLTVEDESGKKETGQMGKIYLKGEPDSPERAMRMEIGPEGAKESEKMVFLSAPKQEAVYMLVPDAKSYFKLSVKEGKSKAPKTPGQGLKPTDFKTVGKERLDGRSVIVKEAPIRDGEKTVGTMRIYVAPDLGNEPLKSVMTSDKGGTTTISIDNPVSATLSDELFRVPKGYTETKMPSMDNMLDQMGKEAEKEGKDEAKEQKDSATKELENEIRDSLPF